MASAAVYLGTPKGEVRANQHHHSGFLHEPPRRNKIASDVGVGQASSGGEQLFKNKFEFINEHHIIFIHLLLMLSLIYRSYKQLLPYQPLFFISVEVNKTKLHIVMLPGNRKG